MSVQSFRLPNLLLKLRCQTSRQVYVTAWAISASDGLFMLDPDRFGVPLRTLKHWASWMVQVAHLWEIVEAGGGRGRRARYRVKGKAEFLQKQEHEEAARQARQGAQNKLCNEATDNDKETTPPCGAPRPAPENSHNPQRLAWLSNRGRRWTYSFDGWERLSQESYGYKKLARCLRYCFWELGAPRSVNDALTGLVLKRLAGLPAEKCKRSCWQLLRWIANRREHFVTLMAKGRVVFSWVAWLLSKFLCGEKPEEAETRRQKLLSDHERGRGKRSRVHGERCQCHACEVARVMQKRAEADRYYGVVRDPEGRCTSESWQAWVEEQHNAVRSARLDSGCSLLYNS